MCLYSNKTGKNPKKPVETEDFRLTKLSERMKVNCGTVLRTRMNTDDFALETGCGFLQKECRKRGATETKLPIRKQKEQDKWQRE
jgi:hypothetical protein